MRRVGALLAACTLLVAGLASAQPLSDWERAQQQKEWRDAAVKLPPYPKPADLIPFEVAAGRGFKFFVDKSSLSVNPDGVVRYALVARSPSGVDNVSYEGMRCAKGTFKVYAFGGPDGKWQLNTGAKWRPIESGGAMPWRSELERDYFCRGGLVPADAGTALAALRRGASRSGQFAPEF